jgi:transposase
MPRPSFPSIVEPESDLRRRLRGESDLRLKARLHLLVLVQSGRVATQGEAAEALAVHPNTVWRWLQTYREGGLKDLLTLGQRGAPAGQRAVPPPVFEALKRRLQDPMGFGSYGEVQQWLQEEFGLEVPYKTVHGLVRYRLKAKLKRPRPRHAKKTSRSRPTSLLA